MDFGTGEVRVDAAQTAIMDWEEENTPQSAGTSNSSLYGSALWQRMGFILGISSSPLVLERHDKTGCSRQ